MHMYLPVHVCMHVCTVYICVCVSVCVCVCVPLRACTHVYCCSLLAVQIFNLELALNRVCVDYILYKLHPFTDSLLVGYFYHFGIGMKMYICILYMY